MSVTEAQVTIHDLARKLHVSSTTVWRALNNSPRVSAKTRELVLAAASAANYAPSLVAQTLSRGKTQLLGIVVPMIGNPVYASLVRSVEKVAFDHDYNMIVCDTDFSVERERQYVDLLWRRRVEGIVLIPFAKRLPSDIDHLQRLAERGIQLVTMQQAVRGAQIASVVPDNRGAARQLTQHLISLGHRNIAFMHGGLAEWNVSMRERYQGYCDALAAADIERPPENVIQVGQFETVLSGEKDGLSEEVIDEFVKRPHRATAVVAPVDVLAIKIMDAFSKAGLNVPKDVAVVGFDDVLMSAYTAPPLTTVRQPSAQIGRLAAERLFAAIQQNDANPRPMQQVECELVIRESCGSQRATPGATR